MLCQVKIPFKSSKNLRYSRLSSSVMHGIIMENISPEYADKMHGQSLRPFSQYVSNRNGSNLWVISTLDREAFENIICPVTEMKTAFVRHKNDVISFGNPEQVIISYNELLLHNKFITGKYDLIRLDFVTPTAFKSAGNYVNIPSVRLLFGSLARRFDSFYGIQNNDYEVFICEAERNISFAEYSLNSSSFSLEGIRVPSFMGNVVFRITGDEDFRRYISMLCEFAEYSGTGIKTALGMGQISVSR